MIVVLVPSSDAEPSLPLGVGVRYVRGSCALGRRGGPQPRGRRPGARPRRANGGLDRRGSKRSRSLFTDCKVLRTGHFSGTWSPAEPVSAFPTGFDG
jgi:hypothetical protein